MFSSATEGQILSIVDKNIEKVRHEVKREVLHIEEKWEQIVSPEWLFDVLNEDIRVASERNYYSFSPAYSDSLLHIIKELYPDKHVYSSGHFYYPKTGYMGWHTNSSQPDEHLYIVYASEDKESFFRYYQDDEVITHYDNKGLNIRTFKATDQRPFFWHCVGSNCDRYSFGYRLLPKDETHHH